jgi:hypothetical protein
MQRVDFYSHDGCPSQQSILLLAKDVKALYPTWTVMVHRLAENDIDSLGFLVLPAVAINGQTVATGIPSKEWLLKKLGEGVRPDQ